MHASLDLPTRFQMIREWPIYDKAWNGSLSQLTLPPPRNQEQKGYLRAYVEQFHQRLPPRPPA